MVACTVESANDFAAHAERAEHMDVQHSAGALEIQIEGGHILSADAVARDDACHGSESGGRFLDRSDHDRLVTDVNPLESRSTDRWLLQVEHGDAGRVQQIRDHGRADSLLPPVTTVCGPDCTVRASVLRRRAPALTKPCYSSDQTSASFRNVAT